MKHDQISLVVRNDNFFVTFVRKQFVKVENSFINASTLSKG